MKRTVLLSMTMTGLLGWTGSAHAELQCRLGGLAVYDTVQNITWLADANAGAGSPYDNGHSTTDGRMTWANANAWAASLTLGGFNDWRLPDTPQTDLSCDELTGDVPPQGFGLNCTGSEMGHLFYEGLSGTAGQSILLSGDPDLTLFSNISDYYWSRTEFEPNTLVAWLFTFSIGSQQANNSKESPLFAWAVRDGDVEVPSCSTASWSVYGAGHPGTLCTPSLSVSANPELGTTITLTADNCRGIATGAGLAIGFSPASLPFAGGTLLVSPPMTLLVMGVPQAGLSLSGPLPCEPTFCGVCVYLQLLQLDPGASNNYSMTNGLELCLGY